MRGPRRWDDHPYDCICPRCLRSSSKRRGADALRRRLQPDSEEPAAHSQPAGRKFLAWTAVTAAVGLVSVLLAFAFVIEPTRTEVREFLGFSQPVVPTPSVPLPFQALAQARQTPVPTSDYSIDDVDISLTPTETGATAQLTVTVTNTSGGTSQGPVALLLSVDSGAPELATTFSDLAADESGQRTFVKDLSPGQHTLTLAVGDARRDLTIDVVAIPSPSWQTVVTAASEPSNTPGPTLTPTVSQSPLPVQQVVATPVLDKPTETPEPTSLATVPTGASTATAVVTTTPEPTVKSVEPTATPVPLVPTVEPTATPIPAVSLVLDTDTTVVGYWQDGTADVGVEVSLRNTGAYGYYEDVPLSVICPVTLTEAPGCDEELSLSLADGYGPAIGSFVLRLPMGQGDIELSYGDDSLAVGIGVPERILGVERHLWECYADREPIPDPWQAGAYLYGCSGWASPTVVKWLNDVPVKVWATGDPQYIETLDEVLNDLSPVLSLDFVWVEAEADADFRAFVGVKREDVDHLGFAPSSVDWGGFAKANLSSGEARSGYMVVWLIEPPPVDAAKGIIIHETLHALVPTHHTTRPVSIMGGGGLNRWSRRDEQLMRLNSHRLIRHGMTMQEVRDLIVLRDELLDDPGPRVVTDPLEMVWRAYESLYDADSAGYKLTGGWIDRGCSQTFGVRRGPLKFKIGKFRRWRDDPSLLYFHDHVNEFWVFWDEDWHSYTRPLIGGDWRSVSGDDLQYMTTWWGWKGKFHRAIRSVIADSTADDFTVETTDDGNIRVHIRMDESYVYLLNWEDWGIVSLDFTLDLDPDTYEIKGYHWLHRKDPGLDHDGCITYEEVATDFQVGVEIKLPEELRND